MEEYKKNQYRKYECLELDKVWLWRQRYMKQMKIASTSLQYNPPKILIVVSTKLC